MYLEGTDQHRGWFHSSLLESCGTRGFAPFESVLTHGFVLDENGRKMSKSLGNVTSPQDVLKEYGADILRLWVIGSDYYDDLRIGKEILVSTTEEDYKFSNRLAIVQEVPLGYTGPVKKGDTLLVHHNVFKFYNDMRGRQQSGKSFFKDDLFFIDNDQFFLYKQKR